MFFKDYFKAFRTVHNTRGSGENLMLPKGRTETARKSFYFNGSKLFNDVPNEMKDLNSVMVFKTHILEFYRSQAFFKKACLVTMLKKFLKVIKITFKVSGCI